MGKNKRHNKPPCLDLHGFTVDQVEDTVDRFLRDARGDRALIMTGKGSGKVRETVIGYLKLAQYPWQFETGANGQPNQGVIVVFLD